MKKWVHVVTLLLVALVVPLHAGGSGMALTRDEAIRIAVAEARRLDYPVASMDVKVEDSVFTWKAFVRRHPQYADDAVKTRLQLKRFWAIYLGPKKNSSIIFGGDIFVFVDVADGNVLGVIRGR